MRKTSTLSVMLSYAFAGVLVIFALFPILWAFLTSLKPESSIVSSTLHYIPAAITLENYVNVWERSNFPVLIRNSALVTALTLLFTVSVGTLASYAVARVPFRGRPQLLSGYLVARMFPSVMIVIPMFVLLRSFGLLDSVLGLALGYTAFSLPIFIWMMKGFFDAVPAELEDAARIDGASRLGALFRIILPLVRGGLASTAVFIGIGSWNEYLFALMLTTSTGSRTWPVGLQLMVGEFQLPWGTLAAGGIISIVPVIILFVLVQRILVGGLMAGAIKG